MEPRSRKQPSKESLPLDAWYYRSFVHNADNCSAPMANFGVMSRRDNRVYLCRKVMFLV